MTIAIPNPIDPAASPSSVPMEVDVQTVSEWRAGDKNWVLVDCREQNEFDVAHIQGAVLLPMSQWQQVSGKLDSMRDKHIVVHCHHGGRSLRVANWMRENGFPTAQSMAGGIDRWSQTIDELVPRY